MNQQDFILRDYIKEMKAMAGGGVSDDGDGLA